MSMSFDQAAHNLPLRASTTKIPPGWNEATSYNWSFRQYKQALSLWLATTELDPFKIGPALVARLEGTAKVVGQLKHETECEWDTGNDLASELSHG